MKQNCELFEGGFCVQTDNGETTISGGLNSTVGYNPISILNYYEHSFQCSITTIGHHSYIGLDSLTDLKTAPRKRIHSSDDTIFYKQILAILNVFENNRQIEITSWKLETGPDGEPLGIWVDHKPT